MAPLPTAHAQAACDDLSSQVATLDQQLDRDKQAVQPWLDQAVQFANQAPADLAVAAQQGVPGLTPDLAASYGGLAVAVATQMYGWQSANADTASADYLRDLLQQQLPGWKGTLGTLLPIQGFVSSLVGLNAALGQIDQILADAAGDLAQRDSLGAQLQNCQAANPTPVPEPTPAPEPAPDAGAGNGGALCNVGGKSGASSSDCFSLEMDAAYAVWAACTEQYFAAEDEAFRSGGDPPANTCDPAWKAAIDAIQQRWGAPSP